MVLHNVCRIRPAGQLCEFKRRRNGLFDDKQKPPLDWPWRGLFAVISLQNKRKLLDAFFLASHLIFFCCYTNENLIEYYVVA